jgi:L-serine dehydratase
MARDLMGGEFLHVLIEFDPNGSLATTHQSQGSDMGIFGGFLGWNATDNRLVDSHKALKDAGISAEIQIKDYRALHPNTYRLALSNSTETHEMTAISTGGGMVEVIEIDGAEVSIKGDYFETLVFFDSSGIENCELSFDDLEAYEINLIQGPATSFLQIKGQDFVPDDFVSTLPMGAKITAIKQISPVLPVLSHNISWVPFITCEEMLQYNQDKDLDLWELALHYESARGDISPEQVFQKMNDIVEILCKSIREGIAGTDYKDRILGYQSGPFLEKMSKNDLLETEMLNRIILYTTALMEVKSSMGVIVAAPTAGACGGLPGACIGAAESMGVPTDEITKGMLSAGLIGVFIAAHATFSAELGGCQAECGAGSGMAAAALVTLRKGSVRQATAAASMALQNILGMICDPVANRVEVPCLGKNVLAASNALASANMALGDFDPVIPLDEVITAMDKVGGSIPRELRCTALGGLSITDTSKEIERRLKS